MEKRRENPRLPDELQDPKVPVIHALVPGNRAQSHQSEAPVPETSWMLGLRQQ